jgi:hypothetical protein
MQLHRLDASRQSSTGILLLAPLFLCVTAFCRRYEQLGPDIHPKALPCVRCISASAMLLISVAPLLDIFV